MEPMVMGSIMTDKITRVLHVITTLDRGGAETFLTRLLKRMDRTAFPSAVICLSDGGVLAQNIRQMGIPLLMAGIRKGRTSSSPVSSASSSSPSSPDFNTSPASAYSASCTDIFSPVSGLLRMILFAGRFKPHVIQTWMYHADLAGTLLASTLSPLKKGPALAWNIRQSSLEPSVNSSSSLYAARICSALSSLCPDAIISCSGIGAMNHARFGYDSSKMILLSNGFDCGEFNSHNQNRRKVRAELGLSQHDFVMGFLARWDPNKDHHTLLQAMAKLMKKVVHENAAEQNLVKAEPTPGTAVQTPGTAVHTPKLVLAGRGMNSSNIVLTKMLQQTGTLENVILLDEVASPASILDAMDCYVSSSRFEGFPNSLGEAMTASLPCIATQAGDSALLLGETGICLPPSDPERLSAAMHRIFSMSGEKRRIMGSSARRRILDCFSMKRVAATYSTVYADLAWRARARGWTGD